VLISQRHLRNQNLIVLELYQRWLLAEIDLGIRAQAQLAFLVVAEGENPALSS